VCLATDPAVAVSIDRRYAMNIVEQTEPLIARAQSSRGIRSEAPTWSQWLATARSIDPDIPNTDKTWDPSFREELLRSILSLLVYALLSAAMLW
jgi:hypothetical protein